LTEFRFSIPWLDFEPVEHRYYLDGKEVPSVSEVLGLAKFNSTRYGKSGHNSAWRGTTAHAACEFWDDGTLDESSLDPRLKGYLDAWRKFRTESGAEPVLIEQQVGHRDYMYAGTLDRLMRIGPRYILLDIKTGAKRSWHEIQGVAYLAALEHCRSHIPIDLPVGRIEVMTVYLTHDGGYDFKPVDDPYGKICIFEGAIPRAKWQAALGAEEAA
jgi:hypothetical protein